MKRSTGWALALWLLVTVVTVGSVLPQPISFGLFVPVAAVALIHLWYTADVAERRLSPPFMLGVAIVLLTLVAVPYYWFRYRGWRRALIILGKVLGAWFATGVIILLGKMMTL